jgi:hypothetical protein
MPDLPIRRALVPLGLYLIGALVFFRGQWRSAFDLLMGDRGDARLVGFLHEHVYRWAFSFEVPFLSPPFFYNQTKTLGYTDAFVLNQVFYAPFRLLGAEPLLAQSLTIIALSAVGYLFCYMTFRRFNVTVGIAALAALVFTFPNNLFLVSPHQQHFAVYYLPAVVYCAVAAVGDLRAKPRRAYVLSAIAGGLYGLTFSTGFYMAWFFGLSLLIFAPLVILLAWPVVRRWWRENAREAVVLALIAGAAFMGALAIFTVIYGPVLALGLTWAFSEYLYYAPHLSDIINVSKFNIIWGNLIRTLGLVSEEQLVHNEHFIALTPTVQAFVLASLVSAAFPRFWPTDEQGRLMRAVTIGCATVCILLYILTLKVGDQSLFRLLHAVVPGAKAIRAGYRGMVVGNLFAATAMALTMHRAIILLERSGRTSRTVPVGALYGLLGFCVVEQVNWGPSSQLSRKFEAAWINRIGDPPSDCRAFFVADEPTDPTLEGKQIDAMMVAQAKRLPTLNGYSGLKPPGWDFLNTKDPDYERRIQVWAINRKLDHVCRLDVDRGTWTPVVLDRSRLCAGGGCVN